jgi:Holliday junction resolvasome RuvABC endonuclease subunit
LNVVGLDLSLTATGVSNATGCYLIKTKPKDWEMPHGDVLRIDHIAAEVSSFCAGADLVICEGFSFGSKGSALFQVAGLGYIVRSQILRSSIPLVLPTPSQLKFYITGRGNADKPTMRMETFKRFELDIADDNECDAFGLRAMALDYYGCPLVKMPAHNRTVLDKVEWP